MTNVYIEAEYAVPGRRFIPDEMPLTKGEITATLDLTTETVTLVAPVEWDSEGDYMMYEPVEEGLEAFNHFLQAIEPSPDQYIPFRYQVLNIETYVQVLRGQEEVGV